MRTYTHGVVGYLLYLRGTPKERGWAATGGVLPDAVLALGFLPHVAESYVEWVWMQEVHELLHFGWPHLLTEAMHSFVVIGLALAVGIFVLQPLVPLSIGMLAHAAVDLLTHDAWAYNHFLPLPLEPIRSPLSYTNPWFTALEHLAVGVFAIWILRRRFRRSGGGAGGQPD